MMEPRAVLSVVDHSVQCVARDPVGLPEVVPVLTTLRGSYTSSARQNVFRNRVTEDRDAPSNGNIRVVREVRVLRVFLAKKRWVSEFR